MRAQLLAKSPELVSLLDRCVTTDPEISSDIAEANFQSMSDPSARALLDAPESSSVPTARCAPVMGGCANLF